jgi:hypothetical protein
MVYSIVLPLLRYALQYDAMTRRTCVITVIWLVTPRSLTEIYQDFGGKFSYTLKMEAKLSSEEMINF